MQYELRDSDLMVTFEEDLVEPQVRELVGSFKRGLAENAQLSGLALDMTGVGLIDSYGINLVVALHKECESGGHRFRLTGVGPEIKRVFDRFKLERLFGVE